MKKSIILACGVAAMCASSAMAQFVNGSFEDNGGSFGGWTTFEQAYITDIASHDNSGHAAKVFGNFNWQWNADGFFQDIPAAPGQDWFASAWFQTPAADSIAGTQNFAVINIEWHAADGSMISYVSTTGVSGSSTPGQWKKVIIASTAPAGTATARVVGLFLQPNYEGGSALIDDIQFYNLGCPADFNHDGVVDFFDYLDFVDGFSIGC
jgi:hypothetical protein